MIRRIVEKELFRFLIVGGINTLFGYSIFSLFILFHVHYAYASLFSTMIGMLFNFKTIGIVVFKNNKNSLLFKFILVYIIIFIVQTLSLKILGFLLDTNLYISAAIMIIPLAGMSFLLNKKFVFKN